MGSIADIASLAVSVPKTHLREHYVRRRTAGGAEGGVKVGLATVVVPLALVVGEVVIVKRHLDASDRWMCPNVVQCVDRQRW